MHQQSVTVQSTGAMAMSSSARVCNEMKQWLAARGEEAKYTAKKLYQQVFLYYCTTTQKIAQIHREGTTLSAFSYFYGRECELTSSRTGFCWRRARA